MRAIAQCDILKRLHFNSSCVEMYEYNVRSTSTKQWGLQVWFMTPLLDGRGVLTRKLARLSSAQEAGAGSRIPKSLPS